MFRTMEIEGEECTVWTTDWTVLLARTAPYTRSRIVREQDLADVPAASLESLANAEADPSTFLAALAGVRPTTVAGWSVTLHARHLWSLITGIHWHDRPRASLPSDPTEPPF